MNFFEAQDRARRRTAWMVFLFILAVAGLIGGLYFAFHLYLHGDAPAVLRRLTKNCLLIPFSACWPWSPLERYIKLMFCRSAAVWRGRIDGRTVVSPATGNSDERRLLNVVTEMALAAGTPVPPVFLMPEPGINAFAAGTTVSNAVIGLLRAHLPPLTATRCKA